MCRVIKAAAFLLLLIGFVLPLSRCSTQGDSGAEPGGYEYYYAWSDFHADSLFSWLTILAFFWPLPFIYHANIPKAREPKIWMRAAEIVLSGGSMYMIYSSTILRELWFGGYLSYTALGLYLGVSLVELVAAARGRIRKKRRVEAAE